ncbi:DedA family protein [Bacillus alkalicellulosilyticus]|uniref:DedA family protein n=1 Tax=Alkalihalobacterium alkalicellulosilyticum TaxID=1912214 RepID=UPI0009964295|nr:DedA family protein [Bacillus alkalicellulosilyticus]
MDSNGFVELINQSGYVTLFLSFYICLLGLPIPNEVVVMTGGFLSETTYLNPVLTFLIIYGTVTLNATILFLLGRTCGHRLMTRLTKFERVTPIVSKATYIVHRYGTYATAFCYVLPIVRHLVPFVIGVHRFSFPSFARYSYGTAFVWTLTLFLVGKWFGSKIEVIGSHLYELGIGLVIVMAFSSVIVVVRKHWTEVHCHH